MVTLSGRSTSQFFGVIRVGRQHLVPPANRDDHAMWNRVLAPNRQRRPGVRRREPRFPRGRGTARARRVGAQRARSAPRRRRRVDGRRDRRSRAGSPPEQLLALIGQGNSGLILFSAVSNTKRGGPRRLDALDAVMLIHALRLYSMSSLGR